MRTRTSRVRFISHRGKKMWVTWVLLLYLGFQQFSLYAITYAFGVDFDCYVKIERSYSHGDVRLTQFANPRNGLCFINKTASTGGYNLAVKCNGSNYIKAFFTISADISFQLECKSGFPLDLTSSQAIVPFESADVQFGERDEGDKYSVILKGEEDTCDDFFMSSNYTVFSLFERDLNLSIDLRFIHVLSENTPLPSRARTGISDIALMCADPIKVTDFHISCTIPDATSDITLKELKCQNPTRTTLRRSCFTNEAYARDYAGCTQASGTLEQKCSCSHYCEASWKPSYGVVHCAVGKKKWSTEYFTSVDGRSVISNMSAIWEGKNVIRVQKQDNKTLTRLKLNQTLGGQQGLENSTVAMFYESEYYHFECHFLKYFLRTPIVWFVEFANKTQHVIYTDYRVEYDEPELLEVYSEDMESVQKTLEIKSSHLKVQGIMGMEAIKCTADYWNFARRATARFSVEIKSLNDTTAPRFEEEETSHFVSYGSSLKLNCSVVDGNPEPEYSWIVLTELRSTKPNQMYFFTNNTVHDSKSVSVVTIIGVGEGMDGDYICVAKNIGHETKKKFKVFIVKGLSPWISAGIPVAVSALLFVILVVLSRKYCLQRGRLTSMEIKLFEKGDEQCVKSDKYAHENAQFMPYNRRYEIKWKDFKINEEEKLGEGAYGVVFKGALSKHPGKAIAVKTVRPGMDKSVILALLSELKVMIHLEKHENIVTLLGACTEFLRDGRVYILAELCPTGSLESILRAIDRQSFVQKYRNPQQYVKKMGGKDSLDDLNLNDFYRWAVQISRGMQHLQSKRVIHGDLATRNVLLYSMSVAKITDFGLSRQLLGCENYVKKSQTKLPWRWLSLETLKTLVFSHKSDVWSYGVTIWEIFSLGLVPYPGMSWTPEFVGFLEQNLRLSPPQFATDETYKILTRCWEEDPADRPNFREIEIQLSKEANKSQH